MTATAKKFTSTNVGTQTRGLFVFFVCAGIWWHYKLFDIRYWIHTCYHIRERGAAARFVEPDQSQGEGAYSSQMSKGFALCEFWLANSGKHNIKNSRNSQSPSRVTVGSV
jgi:hypothetical protein